MRTAIDHILFIDIETASSVPSFEALSDKSKILWQKKMARELLDPNHTEESLYQTKAGIYAEFGQIICICIGIFDKKNNAFRIKTIASENEEELLGALLQFFGQLKPKIQYKFCGHNIKEFDIPFICRRMVIHGKKIPKMINLQDVKPWESTLIDTLSLWKFGDYKHFTSLDLLTHILGIESSKTDLDGSMVSGVFWSEKALQKIVTYCQNDVKALIQVYLKLSQTEGVVNPEFVLL
jgi:hypothetical protein